MSGGNMHRLAQVFRARCVRELGLASVGLGLRPFGLRGFGLVVAVRRLPAWRFGADFLSEGPGVGRPLLSEEGRILWDRLYAIATDVVARHGEPGDMAGLILMPEAIEDARAELALPAQEAA